MISSSMKFAKDIVKLRDELQKMGHDAIIPYGTEPHLTDSSFVENLEDNMKYCIEDDVMMKNFKLIQDQDAILVYNKKRNNINGYIGTSALMEVAIAYYLKKKIFIMYDIPHFDTHRWAHEVTIMQPTFLKGDISKIH